MVHGPVLAMVPLLVLVLLRNSFMVKETAPTIVTPKDGA